MEVMEDAIDATKVGNIYLCFVFFWSRYSTNTYIPEQHDLEVKSHTILKRSLVSCAKLRRNRRKPYLLKVLSH